MEAKYEKPRRGLIAGRFAPLHRGHDFAIRMAAAQCGELLLLAETDRVAQQTRRAFADVPNLRVETLRAETPTADVIFGSYDVDRRFARQHALRFIPIDPNLELVPVSTANPAEADLLRNWTPCRDPKKVVLYGGESVGKTILAQRLAKEFATQWSSEWVRVYLEEQDLVCGLPDMHNVARGQIAQEEALARQARGILFCDTNLFSTISWSEWLYGEAPQWIREEADRRHYDLYLVPDVDAPWSEDPQRCLPREEDRIAFHRRCIERLEERGLPYVLLRGDWEARFRAARNAVNALLPN